MHLDTETAFDMMEGRVEPQRYRYWSEHLGSCDHCRGELDRSHSLRKHLKREHLKSASSEDISRAVNLFHLAQAEEPSAVRRVLAELLFDSFAQPALAGARGMPDARQIVLRVEEFDVHVKIWGSEENRHIMGQLLPRRDSKFGQPLRLHLLRSGFRLETTDVDETGEFRFDEISDGPLSLQIDLPHITVIGPLDDPRQS